MFIDDQLLKFKNMLENSIITKGVSGKHSIIRSQILINLIHDAVKKEFITRGINPCNIYPHFGETKPELKLAGFLKQKDQDICLVPSGIPKSPTEITWGPLAFERKRDLYGKNFTTNTLVINVRSQMSSLDKNSDTLFERTYAESLNLHMRYPDIVLGDVYLIPTHEYDDAKVKLRKVAFKHKHTNIEKYLSFFDAISGRQKGGPDYKYERCALLIVDFRRDQPYLFKNSSELKKEGLISHNFSIEYSNLNFQTFADDILKVYSERYSISNLKI